MKIRYGTSGNPPNFFKSQFGKDRVNAPDWIRSIGLNAYERMMTYGARMKEDDAVELGKKAKLHDIFLSVHGPYYIVLTSDKPRVVKNSIKEMLKTIRLSNILGAERIVFHPGFGTNVKAVIKNLRLIEKNKPKTVTIHPETMGKMSQLGSLNDVITICENTECEPCIDFAHLYARNLGKLDFRKTLEEIEKRLGKKSLKEIHCHFYPVEFGEKGEKFHRAVTEKNVFPRFIDFAPLIKEFNMTPTLISESRDSQDIGALEMKRVMERLLS